MKKILPLILVSFLSGCASPLTILNENQTDKINYAYSSKLPRDVADCLKVKWQTRDVHAVLRTYQFESLVETKFPDFIRLTLSNTLVIDVMKGDKTSIREIHQEDIHYIMKGVIKDVMIQCSDTQKFTNLLTANEKVMSGK
jgi:hypothetical protein